ncbi:MAG TPA: GNAT family N-acetyltransferase [Candidatus Angelobacter sp.]|nr:GNAT family N-acetyltransferase [Candidatus Angelobacter sp.]
MERASFGLCLLSLQLLHLARPGGSLPGGPFVLPEMRGKGIGKALLRSLAQIALDENLYGLRWMVLEWNTPALKFYDSLSAELLDEWETMLLRGEPLQRLARTGD